MDRLAATAAVEPCMLLGVRTDEIEKRHRLVDEWSATTVPD
jgi:hypothetical protein